MNELGILKKTRNSTTISRIRLDERLVIIVHGRVVVHAAAVVESDDRAFMFRLKRFFPEQPILLLKKGG